MVSQGGFMTSAVLAFEKGNPILKLTAETFVKNFDSKVYGSGGPNLISDIAQKYFKMGKQYAILT